MATSDSNTRCPGLLSRSSALVGLADLVQVGSRGSLLLLLVENKAVSANQVCAVPAVTVLPIVLPWFLADRAGMDMAHSKIFSGLV